MTRTTIEGRGKMTVTSAVRASALLLALVAIVAALGHMFGWVINRNIATDADSLAATANSNAALDSQPIFGMSISIIRLNLTEHRIEMKVELSAAGIEDKYSLVDSLGNSVQDEHTGEILPQFAAMTVNVSISESTGAPGVTVAYPLSKLFSRDDFEDRTISTSITADGRPQSFPNDSYDMITYVNVRLPQAVSWIPSNGPARTSTSTEADFHRVPVVFSIVLDGQLSPQWLLETSSTVSDAELDSSPLVATLSRPWSYWCFLYSISLMPAVLGFSFYIQSRRQQKSETGGTSGSIELAAALLALLTLRQVFVPADIPGLTNLDLLLGIQVLAACWMTATVHLRLPAVTDVKIPDEHDSTAHAGKS